MKKGKNLTENKGLINTFKKFKSKNHIFKSVLKKKYYFFTKFQQKIIIKNIVPSKKFFFKKIFLPHLKPISPSTIKFFATNNLKNNTFKKILMFY